MRTHHIHTGVNNDEILVDDEECEDEDETPLSTGYLVRAPRHAAEFMHTYAYSEISIDCYRPGRAYGTWSFDLLSKGYLILIERHYPTKTTGSGMFCHWELGPEFRVSADEWQLDPVGLVSCFLDEDVAAVAAPMLWVPKESELLAGSRR